MSALAIVVPAALAAPTAVGQTGWTHQLAGFKGDGAVTVKSLGGGSYSGTLNPTGAVARPNQNVATQAPTVIVQATATLPIKNAGDACTLNTTGVSPNSQANEGTAITLDRTTLLGCQGGVWTKIGGNVAVVEIQQSLASWASATAANVPACPAGWIEAALSSVTAEASNTVDYTRTCFKAGGASLSLRQSMFTWVSPTTTSPPPCPAAWAQASLTFLTPNIANTYYYIRTCVK